MSVSAAIFSLFGLFAAPSELPVPKQALLQGGAAAARGVAGLLADGASSVSAHGVFFSKPVLLGQGRVPPAMVVSGERLLLRSRGIQSRFLGAALCASASCREGAKMNLSEKKPEEGGNLLFPMVATAASSVSFEFVSRRSSFALLALGPKGSLFSLQKWHFWQSFDALFACQGGLLAEIDRFHESNCRFKQEGRVKMAHKSPGVAKLLSVMRKLSEEVNDQEICRRLGILMTSEKADLPATVVRELLSAPEKFDPSIVQDPYSQYIRHYLYMIKRAGHEKSREALSQVLTQGGGAGTKVRRGGRKKAAVNAKKLRKKTIRKASAKKASSVKKKKPQKESPVKPQRKKGKKAAI